MIDLNVMQQPAKADRVEPARQANMPKSKDNEQPARFDQEYQSQGTQETETNTSTDREIADEKRSGSDGEETDGKQQKATDTTSEAPNSSSKDVTDTPDVAAVEAPAQKPAQTRALSENAFGEQIAQARKAQVGVLKQEPRATAVDQEATKVSSQSSGEKTPVFGPAAKSEAQPLVVAASASGSRPSPNPTGTTPLAKKEAAVDSAQVPQFKTTDKPLQSSFAIPSQPKETSNPALVDSAKEESIAKSDERRARLVASKLDAAPSDFAPRSATVQAAPPKPLQMAAQSTHQIATVEKVELVASTGEIDAPVPFDAKANSTATLQQILNRPETPAMVSRQMAEALHRNPDRPVEVALNPEELGRVRMSISAADTGITVTVLAERPETLEMMRRHIDQLAREFQAIGYDNISFAFAEGQAEQNQNPDHDGNQSARGGQQNGALDDVVRPINLAVSSGIDVRV